MQEPLDIVEELESKLYQYEEAPDAVMVFNMLMKILPDYHRYHDDPSIHYTFYQSEEEILSRNRVKLEALADLFDDMGATAVTGYYDPDEDIKYDTVDSLTGFYHLSLD